jgi:hypothetical protein
MNGKSVRLYVNDDQDFVKYLRRQSRNTAVVHTLPLRAEILSVCARARTTQHLVCVSL